MASATSAHSHSGNAVTSVTPANIFALLFEILVFILVVLSIVVLSIVVLVRRYLGARIGTQAQAQSVLVVDLEVQAGQSNTLAKDMSTSRWLSLLLGQLRSRSRDEYLSDATALLDKDSSKSLPLPGSTSRSSSPRISILHKLFGRFRSFPITGVKSVAQPGPTDYPDRVRAHIRTVRDHITREWSATAPGVCGSRYHSPCGTSLPKPAIEIPTIIVTPPEGITISESPEIEAYSPVSTYSEPDSPAITTPSLDSSIDIDIHIPTDETDYLHIPFPSWEIAIDEGETANFSNFSGELFQLRAPPFRKTTADPVSEITSPVDILSHVLFPIQEEPQELEVSTIRTVTPQPDSAGIIPVTESQTVSPQPGVNLAITTDNSLPRILSPNANEDKSGVSRIVNSCAQLDPTPVREFLMKGLALGAAVNNVPCNDESSCNDEEDWEKAFRLGGRLTGAFSSALSSDSLDKDDYDEDDEDDEAYEVLHKTKAVCEVQVHGAPKLISSSSATIEWCESASSSSSHSSRSSDAESDYEDAGSDDESDSSFYSCSESEITEDDAGADSSFSRPKVHSTRPSAFSVLEGYLVQCGYAA